MNNKDFFNAIFNCDEQTQLELRDLIIRHSSDLLFSKIQEKVKQFSTSKKEDLIIEKYNKSPDFNRTHFADEIGVSREYVQRIINKITTNG